MESRRDVVAAAAPLSPLRKWTMDNGLSPSRNAVIPFVFTINRSFSRVSHACFRSAACHCLFALLRRNATRRDESDSSSRRAVWRLADFFSACRHRDSGVAPLDAVKGTFSDRAAVYLFSSRTAKSSLCENGENRGRHFDRREKSHRTDGAGISSLS